MPSSNLPKLQEVMAEPARQVDVLWALREIDEDGWSSANSYNSAKQLVKPSARPRKPLLKLSFSYIRDVDGRILSTRKDVGAMTTVESTEYDDLGRVVSFTDILGRVTRTQYSDNQLTTTVITPSPGATLYYKTCVMAPFSSRREPVSGNETQLSELTQEGILTTTLSQGVVLSRTLQNGFRVKLSDRNNQILWENSLSQETTTTTKDSSSVPRQKIWHLQ